MVDLERLLELLRAFLPLLAVVAAVVLSLWAAHWLLRGGPALGDDQHLSRQLGLLGLYALGLVVVVLALPISDAMRAQLLTVLGLLVSAIIALSSTTLVANAMAGVMLRATKGFRTGDFIRVQGQFGRVTERGLLHTEIQTEDRELTTLPNLYLISNPVTVVRTSGTLVSVSLSLGYDVHHAQVEPLLLEAAKRAELEGPFVRILELGNYSVTYRVSGFLADIKNLLSARSNLCKMVLDMLHGHGIEIMSPAFMGQRPLPPETRMIPAWIMEAAPQETARAPEDLMFDKAERAERIEHHRLRLQGEITELESKREEAKGEDRTRLDEELARRRKQVAALSEAVLSSTS